MEFTKHTPKTLMFLLLNRLLLSKYAKLHSGDPIISVSQCVKMELHDLDLVYVFFSCS